uniref:Uncharacterized protein n=1 Tax=Romanomermis culicivorax TaxID=13658 RepID=A0A915KRX3_ROMCU
MKLNISCGVTEENHQLKSIKDAYPIPNHVGVKFKFIGLGYPAKYAIPPKSGTQRSIFTTLDTDLGIG